MHIGYTFSILADRGILWRNLWDLRSVEWPLKVTSSYGNYFKCRRYSCESAAVGMSLSRPPPRPFRMNAFRRSNENFHTVGQSHFWFCNVWLINYSRFPSLFFFFFLRIPVLNHPFFSSLFWLYELHLFHSLIRKVYRIKIVW